MTLLGILFGSQLPNLLSIKYTKIIAGSLFLYYGVTITRNAYLNIKDDSDSSSEIEKEL